MFRGSRGAISERGQGKSYLFQGACWCSCNAPCRSNSCVPDTVCACSSPGLCTLWPVRSRLCGWSSPAWFRISLSGSSPAWCRGRSDADCERILSYGAVQKRNDHVYLLRTKEIIRWKRYMNYLFYCFSHGGEVESELKKILKFWNLRVLFLSFSLRYHYYSTSNTVGLRLIDSQLPPISITRILII